MQCRWLLLLAEFVVRGRWADDTPDEHATQRDVRRVQIDDTTVELRVRLPSTRPSRSRNTSTRPTWPTPSPTPPAMPRKRQGWLTCDADLRRAGIAQDSHPADIGRRSRTIPTDLRRAIA